MSLWTWLIIIGGILILVSVLKIIIDMASLIKKYRPENLPPSFFEGLPNADKLRGLPFWAKMENHDYRVAFYERLRSAERRDFNRVKQIAMIRIGGGMIMIILGAIGLIYW